MSETPVLQPVVRVYAPPMQPLGDPHAPYLVPSPGVTAPELAPPLESVLWVTEASP